MCVSRRLEVVVEADSSCCHFLSGSGMFTPLIGVERSYTHTHTYIDLTSHPHSLTPIRTHATQPYPLCCLSAHAEIMIITVIITFLLWYNYPFWLDFPPRRSRIEHECLNEKHCILHILARSAWRQQFWGAVLSRGRHTGGVSICHPSTTSQSSSSSILSSLHEGQRPGCYISIPSTDTWHHCW